MAHKATKIELTNRIEEVRLMILDGQTRESILESSKANWNVAKRTCDWYIAQARYINGRIAEEFQKDSLAMAVAQRKFLRCLAHENGDYRLELRIAKDEAKLLGLYKLSR